MASTLSTYRLNLFDTITRLLYFEIVAMLFSLHVIHSVFEFDLFLMNIKQRHFCLPDRTFPFQIQSGKRRLRAAGESTEIKRLEVGLGQGGVGL